MDISVLNLILALLASLCTIGGVIAVTIRYLQASDEYGEPNKWRVVAQTGGLIGVILIITVLISHAAAATPAGKTIVHLGSQPGNSPVEATATANAASTATAISVTATTAAASANATATPAPFPTDIPNYDTLSPYSTATMSPNWRLECGGCDEPIRVQVSTVMTDSGSENMVWTLTFDNHTAQNYDEVYFNGSLQLTDPTGVKHYATGAAVTSPGASIHAGQSAKLQVTFSFLPRHGAVYTLTGRLIVDEGFFTTIIRDYGPQTITFP